MYEALRIDTVQSFLVCNGISFPTYLVPSILADTGLFFYTNNVRMNGKYN